MRTSSRQPIERTRMGDLAATMADARMHLEDTHPAHSTVDYDQATELLDHALWLAGYATRVIEIRVKQSGKSAARAGRGLGGGAI